MTLRSRDHLDQLAPLGGAGGPQLLVRDRVDRGPGRRVGGVVHPARAEVAVEQLAHRHADPGGDVDAVGDMGDRHVADLAVRPQVVPHLARDFAVAGADAVGAAARAERELRHAERLGGLVGVGAAAADERVHVEPEVADERGEHAGDLRGRVGVVAGGHRRVGGEDRALARGGQGVLARHAVLGRRAGDLQPGQRRMALVEVDDAGLHAERVQHAHAADAEQRVLPQPDLGVADVKPRGDPAVRDAVLGPVGVEQQQRHAADVDPPHLGHDVAAHDGDGDRQRLAVVAGDERRGDAVGVRLDPVFVLPARAVDALAEVAVAVHEPDREHRHAAVRGLLENVAGQHAEATGVDRERAVDRVLGAEEGDGALLGHARGDHLRRAVGLDRALQRVDALEEALVLRQLGQPLGMRLLQLPYRVAEGQVPAPRVDVREQLGTTRCPGPPVVVCDRRERPEWFGQPRAQSDRRSAEVGGARVEQGAAV